MHVTSMQREAHHEDLGDDSDSDHHQRRRLYDHKPRQSKLELRHLLSNLDPDAAGALWNSLTDLVVKTVLVAQPHLYQSYRLCRVGKNVVADGRKTREHSVCFEILGFDVVIDRTLRPFLLEVCISPSLFFYAKHRFSPRISFWTKGLRFQGFQWSTHLTAIIRPRRSC